MKFFSFQTKVFPSGIIYFRGKERNMNLQKIGKNIRKIRELRDYDQQYMAEQLGISQSQYSKIEQGLKDISITILDKIATVLDVEKSLLETLEVDSLLKNYKQPTAQTFHQNEKTTYQLVVSEYDSQCTIEPVHEIMYFVQ